MCSWERWHGWIFHGVPGDGQALPDHFPPSPTPRSFGESAGAKEIHIKTEPRVGYFYCIVLCTGLEFESNRQKMFDLPVLLMDKLNYTWHPEMRQRGGREREAQWILLLNLTPSSPWYQGTCKPWLQPLLQLLSHFIRNLSPEPNARFSRWKILEPNLLPPTWVIEIETTQIC